MPSQPRQQPETACPEVGSAESNAGLARLLPLLLSRPDVLCLCALVQRKDAFTGLQMCLEGVKPLALIIEYRQ